MEFTHWPPEHWLPEQCVHCEKLLKAPVWWVHMLLSGDFVSHDYVGPIPSQGFFPVGAECRRKFPTAVRGALTPEGLVLEVRS